MVVSNPCFSPRGGGLALANARLRRPTRFALLHGGAVLLVLPLILVGQAWADDNASADNDPNASLPLPELKPTSPPQPTSLPQPAVETQPSGQTRIGGKPQPVSKAQSCGQAQSSGQAQASGKSQSTRTAPLGGLPQLVAKPQPSGQPQLSGQAQPSGQAPLGALSQLEGQPQAGARPQVSGQPSSRLPQLPTSRRIPLSEPLPPVDPPPTPIALQPLVRGANAVMQSVVGTSYRQSSSAAPDQVTVPMPLVRPQQVTVPGGLRPLSDITTDIAPPSGPLPKDRSDVLVVGTINPMFYARSANLVRYEWEAPVVCHRPLYFQDVPLEHFGQSCCPCLQPVISAAKFLGNVLILPYRVALDPPCNMTYNLRTYPRPGTPVPCLRESLPLRLKPLLVEIGVVTAIVLVIP